MRIHSQSPHGVTEAASFSLVQEGEPGVITQSVQDVLDPKNRLAVRMGLPAQVSVIYTQSECAIFLSNTHDS